MSSHNLQRPKRGETLEDLIEQEKVFLETKKSCKNSTSLNPVSAVSAVRLSDESDRSQLRNSVGKISKREFQENQAELTKVSCFTGLILEKNIDVPLDLMKNPSPTNKKNISIFQLERSQRELKTQEPKVNSDVMKKVKENYDIFDPFKISTLPGGIPEIKSKPLLQMNLNTKPQHEAVSSMSTSFGERIHPMLAGYTEADILNARESLLANMKSETKDILLKRRSKDTKIKDSSSKETECFGIKNSTNTNTNNNSHNNVKATHGVDDLPIAPEEVKNVPQMDQVELEKLEWTKSVKIDQSKMADSNGRSARFALNGKLVTKDIEANSKTWDQGLHHHGEEMERPGYTIEELLMLARSQFPQQRTLGLNVLAEIFQRSHEGEFDLSLDTSIFEPCDEIDFIHVLRVAADNRDTLSLNSSINCIAALLFPKQEEFCLDICYNWPNSDPYPWLVNTTRSTIPTTSTNQNSTEEEIKESDIKDFQYVKNDLIEFFVKRTNIITRCNYFLHNMPELLNESGVQGIFQILIRIARHSPNEILNCHQLLAFIHEQFMSTNWSETGKRSKNMTGIPLPMALKLFRILVNSNYQIAQTLYDNFNPFPSIMSYLTYKQWGDQTLIRNVEFLIIESFNLWEAFLDYGLGVHEYMSFFPVLMEFFQKLYSRDILCSFDLTHTALLFSLLGKVLRVTNECENRQAQYIGIKESIGFVSSFLIKLLVLLSRPSTAELLDHDFSLLALLKGLECLNMAHEFEKFPKVDAGLRQFLKNPSFPKITSCLLTHSLLLLRDPLSNQEKEKIKYPGNMTSCNAILFGGFQTPILNKGSPFAFMTSLLRYLKRTKISREILKELILDSNVEAYLRKVMKSQIPTRYNTFLRYELYCIQELLTLLEIPERLRVIYKVLPHIQEGDEALAEDLLIQFLQYINIPESEQLTKFYIKFLFIPSLEENSCNFRKLNTKILPRQWMVEPLNILYVTKLKVTKTPDEMDQIIINGVEVTLKCLLFCLEKFSSTVITNVETIPALYTRLVLTFMMGDHVFLCPKIRNLVKSILHFLVGNKYLKDAKGPVFSNFNKVEGFPVTFSSLYSELLVEYASNSFGDEVFGAYLTLPLRTPEDSHLKSLFWNDQCVQFYRATVEESSVPLDYFTSTPERDIDTLRLYQNAVYSKRITIERNQFLHAIIHYHITYKQTTQTEQ